MGKFSEDEPTKIKDRRQFERRKVNLKIKLQAAENEVSDFDWVKNIAEGGAFIATETRYLPGEILSFTLFLEGGVVLLQGKAEVIHQSLGPIQGIGVQFLELKEEDRDKLKKLIDSFEVDEDKERL